MVMCFYTYKEEVVLTDPYGEINVNESLPLKMFNKVRSAILSIIPPTRRAMTEIEPRWCLVGQFYSEVMIPSKLGLLFIPLFQALKQFSHNDSTEIERCISQWKKAIFA